MPRNSSGTYSLPVAAFVPGGLIKSADDNSINNDIATALTQSLATTGVSTMTGPIIAAAGILTTPSIAFNGAPKTGFYLSGTNQIGWAANGAQAATFNADTSTTWTGGASFGGKVSGTMGTIPVGTVMDFASATVVPSGWLQCYGQQVSTTTYAALFAVLGTTYGSGAGTFGIPDCRDRAVFGGGAMGGSDAGRITIAGGNFDGAVYGNSGGSQNSTLITGNLPPYTPGGSIATSTVIPASASPGGLLGQYVTGSGSVSSGTFAGTGTFTGTPQGGVSTPFTNLPPCIIMQKIIYAGA